MSIVGNRLMLPLSALLQRIPARRFDVVLLRDPDQCGFLRGIRGYGDDLAAVVGRLKREIPLVSYATVRCLGVSAGGAAALYAGEMIGASRAVCIGGGHPLRAPELLKARGLDGHELDRVRGAPSSAAPTSMACYFAEDYPRDRANARSLRDVFPAARTVAIPEIAAHNVLFELLKRGQLRRFLEDALLADRGPARPGAPRQAARAGAPGGAG